MIVLQRLGCVSVRRYQNLYVIPVSVILSVDEIKSSLCSYPVGDHRGGNGPVYATGDTNVASM